MAIYLKPRNIRLFYIMLILRTMLVLGIPTLCNKIPRRLKGCRYPRYKNLVGNWFTDHALKVQTLWQVALGGEVKPCPNPY